MSKIVHAGKGVFHVRSSRDFTHAFGPHRIG
jgi:hypothetical protein